LPSNDAVIAALDHGLHWGAYDGLEDPEATLATVLDAGVDGVIAGVPFLRRFEDAFDAHPDVERIATLDHFHESTIPGRDEGAEIQQQVFSAQDAAAAGADAAKIALVYGREDRDVLAENVRFTAEAATECRSVGVDLVVEPTLWGRRIDDEFDGPLLQNAARVGWELGADVLKSPYPGREAFETIVDHAPVPTYIAGGPTAETDREVLEMVAGARDAGGRGVMFGRNIFRREDPGGMVGAMRAIVHDGATVEEAMTVLEGER
jgi:class I fructose-bisphosphate aldolase